jgi:PAS domain S-box-containing protein
MDMDGERLRFLARASVALGASLDLDTTLRCVARVAVAPLADWCIVHFVKTAGEIHRVVAAHTDTGREADVYQLASRYPPDDDRAHPLWQTLRTGQSSVHADASEILAPASAEDDAYARMIRRLGGGSLMLVPLLARGRLLGAITLVRASGERGYDQDDLAVAEELARVAANAVDDARLYAAEQQARAAAEQASDRIAHLQAVTAALSGALTVGEVAEVILGQGVAALGARAGTVVLLSESGLEVDVVRVAGYAPEVVEGSRHFPIGATGSMAEAIRTGRPVWLERAADARAHFPILGQYHDIDGSGALAAIPLLVHGRAVGGLGLIFPDERTFDEQDRAFALTLAAECAQAIERARLHEAERRAFTAAERQARERAAILAQIADGVIVADPAGRVTFMNRVARTLFGLTAEAPTTNVSPASRWLLTAGGERYSPDREPLARAAVHGQEVHGIESRIRQPDGREIVVEGDAVPILADDGAQLGAVLTLRDVTARHELEHQKEAFFANASHDLRTPVATIKASVEVVLENEPVDLPEPLHRLLVNIDHEADRMTTLIDDLLDLARVETGRLRLKLVRCDLRVLAERAARAIEPLPAQRGQRVVLDLPGRPVSAIVDAEWIERALLNLLSNAHKYGRDGGLIRLSLERRPRELVFAVEDDGPGIPKADQARLFERFYRPKTDTTRRSQGSGLGLPIAKGMVELHGGRIWVESRPGAGATFRIALPVGGRRESTR